MCKLRLDPLSARPLVFMNACSSTQGDGAFQSMFLNHFRSRWNACGFIGTDWKIPTVFADAFGRLVLDLVFSKEKPPIAEAFWLASSKLIKEEKNPFPLI